MSPTTKRLPTGGAKETRSHHSSPLSSMAQSSQRKSGKGLPSGSLTSDRKRRAASISSVSSVSSVPEISDEGNDSEEDADDEDDQPAIRAPVLWSSRPGS
ncbi:hypothetical protein HFD88_004478 [Aspergillus terreus]|nr:hypothetical protein HFD88_004478 [Aspergillus terreus]